MDITKRIYAALELLADELERIAAWLKQHPHTEPSAHDAPSDILRCECACGCRNDCAPFLIPCCPECGMYVGPHPMPTQDR